jgi:hypothetical protein
MQTISIYNKYIGYYGTSKLLKLEVAEVGCLKKVSYLSQAQVAHTCNPSYSGGRDQEDHSSKPVQANSLQNPS